MSKIIGEIQLRNLSKENLTAFDIISFINSLLKNVAFGSVEYEALDSLRFHYQHISPHKRININEIVVADYKRNKAMILEIFQKIEKSLSEEEKKITLVIKKNYQFSDKVLEENLGSTIRRMFFTPPSDDSSN